MTLNLYFLTVYSVLAAFITRTLYYIPATFSLKIMILIEDLLGSKYNPLIVDDEFNKETKIAILLVIVE